MVVAIAQPLGATTYEPTTGQTLIDKGFMPVIPNEIVDPPAVAPATDTPPAPMGTTEQPTAELHIVVKPTKPPPTPKPVVVLMPQYEGWHHDCCASWYGPGFYGNRTACGQILTEGLIGVAHKTLPCGTLVYFRNPRNGATASAPVVDRGPYVAGRTWDLTGGLCLALDHCYTGPIEWSIAK